MKKKSIFQSEGFKTVLASLICIVIGMLIGFIALLIINPEHAVQGITQIILNFMNFPSAIAQKKYLGLTLVKTAPLLMCALSICFCYKAGLFNIGAAGQYAAGAGAALYCALALQWNWFPCMMAALIAGAVSGAIVGILKAYRNVNEVITGIMLNWITLYCVNMLLTGVKEMSSPYTLTLAKNAPQAILPSLGMEKLFSNNAYVGIAIPLSIIIAVIIQIVLTKTRFGYELKATGFNKQAARYAGMKENRNIILTLVIGGGLAGLGAAFLYLTGEEQWMVSQASVPSMGFNGISATFLGGLNPIGTIFSSYFIQHITSGGSYLNKTYYPPQIADLISAFIIYLCGFVLFMKSSWTKKSRHRTEKKNDEKKGANA
jgi:simple sugar transport system permease protein